MAKYVIGGAEYPVPERITVGETRHVRKVLGIDGSDAIIDAKATVACIAIYRANGDIDPGVLDTMYFDELDPVLDPEDLETGEDTGEAVDTDETSDDNGGAPVAPETPSEG